VRRVISVPLSRLLIAFTIEFDNEFEHRMPHRTARGPRRTPAAGQWPDGLPPRRVPGRQLTRELRTGRELT